MSLAASQRTPWDVARSTWLESWGAAVRGLSFRHTDVALTLDEAEALTAFSPRYACNKRNVWIPRAAIAAKLEAAVSAYPGGAFVRLGSCSAKDGAYARRHGARVRSGDEALAMLVDSQRVIDDVRTCVDRGYAPHVFVREWASIPPWSEFRGFMRARELVGITQYDPRGVGRSEVIARDAAETERAIRELFARLRWASHIEHAVFDVCVARGESGYRARLIELNPFHPNADPGLFTWENGGDFDGSFRYVR